MTLGIKALFMGLSLIFAAAFLGMAYNYRDLDVSRTMAVIGVCCAIPAVVIFFIPGPRKLPTPDLQVEGTKEPTYRLVSVDSATKGEIWNLVLGPSECVLFDSGGSELVRFDRKIAEEAIKLPGFTRAPYLGIVKNASSFSANPSSATGGQLLSELRSIRGARDRNVPYFWFHPDKRLIPIVEQYIAETTAVVGGEAVAWARSRAISTLRTGLIGLAIGLAILGYGIGFSEDRPGPSNPKPRTITLGGVITLLGAWRAGIGFKRLRSG